MTKTPRDQSIINLPEKLVDLGEQLFWQHSQPLTPPLLSSDDIHLWCIPLTLNTEQTKQALHGLSAQQLDKYNRRDTHKSRQTYLAGRYFLNVLLAAYIDCEVEQLTIAYSRLNKPFLEPNPMDLRFNFSDAKDTVLGDVGVYAFTCGADLGVDIEPLCREGDFQRIAKRKFSQEEQAWVNEGNQQNSAQRFLAIWTRKEAYGKATGQGVNFKMSDLNLCSSAYRKVCSNEKIDSEQHRLEFIGLTDNASPFKLQQFLINHSHIAALVYSGESWRKLRAFLPS